MINAHDIATQVIQAIAEFDDRNSPEDQPKMMLVTALELRDLITSAIQEATPESQPVAWRHSLTHTLHDQETDVLLSDGDEWAQPLYLGPQRESFDMTPELHKILGTMCFQCISFAQALRAAGHTIKSRAEDEQAAVLHWMLGHYFAHGESWREAALADMEDMRKVAIAKQTPAVSA